MDVQVAPHAQYLAPKPLQFSDGWKKRELTIVFSEVY